MATSIAAAFNQRPVVIFDIFHRPAVSVAACSLSSTSAQNLLVEFQLFSQPLDTPVLPPANRHFPFSLLDLMTAIALAALVVYTFIWQDLASHHERVGACEIVNRLANLTPDQHPIF
jgi:hypothetical protein